MRPTHRSVVAGLAGLVMLAGCGSGDDEAKSAAGVAPLPSSGVIAQVASYDLAVGLDQTVAFGLLGEGDSPKLVSFGTAVVQFDFLGDGSSVQPGQQGEATWFAVPGQEITKASATPMFSAPSEAVGVYAIPKVRFDKPGLWRAIVTVQLDGVDKPAEVRFPVSAKPTVPAPGDPAPRSVNLLPGDPAAPPKSVDSRAKSDGTVPDPDLHRITVIDALASGRPTVVVVSTPVFCVSQFCGPITDSVETLAKQFGDQMNFIHLEVWRDYANQAVNKSAADWVFPTQQGDLTEPWVFLVDKKGVITQRWDNVVDERDLRASVKAILGKT